MGGNERASSDAHIHKTTHTQEGQTGGVVWLSMVGMGEWGGSGLWDGWEGESTRVREYESERVRE